MIRQLRSKNKGGGTYPLPRFLRDRNGKPQQQRDQKKKGRKDFTIRRPYKRNTACVEYKNKRHTTNKKSICNHFKIINKTHERTCKSQQGKIEQPHWVPRTYSEKYCCNSTKCLSQNIASTTYCNHKTSVYHRNSVCSTHAIAHKP